MGGIHGLKNVMVKEPKMGLVPVFTSWGFQFSWFNRIFPKWSHHERCCLSLCCKISKCYKHIKGAFSLVNMCLTADDLIRLNMVQF